ncbi:MAG: phospholipid carrier-dependent glycosyltransferase [Porphyrobacter sp.]|nr:phospholipid carrier-dependent glycosyltransferase [Porphyrobacter sp.]
MAIAPHSSALSQPRDPAWWCLIIPLALGVAAAWRLSLPSQPFFDEIHYLPAAREVLHWWQTGTGGWVNPEHPPLGKYLLALGIALMGDDAIGWRIMPLIFGMTALGAGMRAMWHASASRFACIAFGVLLASGFALFVQTRIAMLDIFMAAFLLIAAWQFAAAIRQPETGRWRLAVTGVMLGCAMASKWNAALLAMLPGLTFLIARARAGRRRLFRSRRGAPVPGITLIEACVWLGAVPLVVYALAFVPAYGMGTPLRPSLVSEHGLIGAQIQMLHLQASVIEPHTYMSTWPQWVLNSRGIWYFYELADGSQRGVLLIGNPLTMLLGLPALAWCALAGSARRDAARLAAVIGYGVSLGLWVIAPKPVQFYYHYLMPGTFLLAALALTLADLRRSGQAGALLAWSVLGGSLAVFAWFLPILSAAPLAEGPMSFMRWMWLDSWR